MNALAQPAPRMDRWLILHSILLLQEIINLLTEHHQRLHLAHNFTGFCLLCLVKWRPTSRRFSRLFNFLSVAWQQPQTSLLSWGSLKSIRKILIRVSLGRLGIFKRTHKIKDTFFLLQWEEEFFSDCRNSFNWSNTSRKNYSLRQIT